MLYGQVRGFRLQLWREHLGSLDDIYSQPESPDCMARVRHLAEENWRAYTGDEVPWYGRKVAALPVAALSDMSTVC